MASVPPCSLPHPEVSRDPLTPTRLLERALRVFPERVSVIHGEEQWTTRRLAEEVQRMAGALRRAGVGRGDRVAVLLPNTPVHLAAHFALPLLEAPLVSINTRLAPAEIAYILEHSGAKVLLVDPELAPAGAATRSCARARRSSRSRASSRTRTRSCPSTTRRAPPGGPRV